MTNYGFAIDHRACIGCHACTVACKMENDVPLGVFRTWVKYIERGEFPDSRRYFSVLRCNQCEDAPCISICPTNALFRRPDGIVDFDSKSCIGCKSCMQACPYDALYIDPATETAAKCNYCAHRVEVSLEPACVIVCPTHAIISGDLDDPLSELSELIAREQTQVRAPEKGTRPKVYYVGADEAALEPTLTTQPDSYMWADVGLSDGQLQPRLHEADAKAQTTYDVEHPMLWGWKVSAYLWTKSIAAGAMLVAIAALFAGRRDGWLLHGFAPALALGMTALTGLLLIVDLKQPQRFLYIFLRPNFRSWLVRGAFALGAYAAVLVAWLIARGLDRGGVLEALRWPGIPLAALTAAYTGFLFGQAKGRDLWLSPLLAVSLVAQAGVAGAGALGIAAAAHSSGLAVERFLAWSLLGAVGLWAGLTLLEVSHARAGTRQARAAVRNLVSGPYASRFWSSVLGGMVVPAMLLTVFLISSKGHGSLLATAGGIALAGLFFGEDAYVRAGQSVPLS